MLINSADTAMILLLGNFILKGMIEMGLLNTAVNVIKPLSILSILAEVAFAEQVKPGHGKIHQKIQTQASGSKQFPADTFLDSLQKSIPSYPLIGWSIIIGGSLLLAVIAIKQCFTKITASKEALEVTKPSAKSEEQKQFDALVEECFSLAVSDSTKINEFKQKLARFKPKQDKIKQQQLPCLQNIFNLLEEAHKLMCHPKNNIEKAVGSKQTLKKIQTALEKQIEEAFDKRREIGSNEYIFLHNSLWTQVSVLAKIALIESYINAEKGEMNLHTQQASWTAKIKEDHLNFVQTTQVKVASFIPSNQDELIEEKVMVDITAQVDKLMDRLVDLGKELQQIKVFDPNAPVLTLN